MQGLWGYENIVESPERLQFQMISFTLDPQWCGLLFSIYCRHEKASILGPDAFGTCSLAGPPLDADWIAFAGSIGIEICRLSSSWALILETVKASGVILLLGVGSLVCYKLYHYYWPGSRSRLNSPNSSPPHSRYGENFILYHVQDENQLVEDLDDEDISNIEGRYFGPNPVPSKHSVQHGVDVANFLRRSKFFSIISSSLNYESGASCCDSHEADTEEKQINSSSVSSPCGLQHFHVQPWSLKQNLGPGLHRVYLREQKKACRENGSNWLMKRLQNMLPASQKEQQFLKQGSASLPVTPGPKLKHKNRDRKIVSNWEDGWKCTSNGMFRENKTFSNLDNVSCVIASRKNSFGSNCSPIFAQSRLTRDESFDSLGFSRRLPREGSFDSTCSELSLDISLPEAPNETSTMACLDNLQHEIDQLKSNCLMMDEEFETIKCNRNLPGMSSLMNATVSKNNAENKEKSNHNTLQDSLSQENARACFAGLYSLTTIKNSTSSELSDSFTANGRASVGSAESLAWDSPIDVASPVKMGSLDDAGVHEVIEETLTCNGNDDEKSSEQYAAELTSCIQVSGISTNPIEDNSMADLEWDEEGLDDFVDEEEELQKIETVENLEIDTEEQEKQNSQEFFSGAQSTEKQSNDMIGSMMTTSSYSERSSKAESSGFESKLTDSTITDVSSQWHYDWDQNVNPLNNWASEESGFLEWGNNINCSRQSARDWREGEIAGLSTSEQSTPASDYPLSEAVSPMYNFPTPTTTTENIGPKVDIFEYAMKEWQGQTKKAETILKGYAEIPSLLGVKYLRRIRGDNYCAVRAALFQTLSKGVVLPPGNAVYEYLSNAFRIGNNKWLQNWNFADRLPYEGSNVLHGMKSCLESLDNTVSVLSSSKDRQQTLVMLLNRNPSLDLHLMEAVKLHMLMSSMELHEASTAGLDVPLFAMLMFARDSSETPRDFMNNHLKNVGNTGGLEQVEMFLLGYTLHSTLRVVRPAAHGTEDFICCYPDWNVGEWPEVLLIAEDDRHYNVLVN